MEVVGSWKHHYTSFQTTWCHYPEGLYSLCIILLLFINFLGMGPRVHPKSLKVGHGGTLDHTATGILGTEPLRSIIIYVGAII